MILDRLDNVETYGLRGDEVVRAFNFLRCTDLAAMADGRHAIDGDRVYAIVMRYRPKPVAEAVWEAHRKYLDVQYVVEGVERMGYAPLLGGLRERQPYDPEKDAVFYDATGDLFEVPAGSFAFFGPQDIHAPSLAPASPSVPAEVRKVVVKCRIRGVGDA